MRRISIVGDQGGRMFSGFVGEEPDAMTAINVTGDALARARREAALHVETRMEDLVDAMIAGYQQEIAAYAGLDDPATLAEVRNITRMNVQLILFAIAHGEAIAEEPLSQLRELGRRRADQGFPLHALLRAYQVGTRIAWPYILDGVTSAVTDPGVAADVVASVSLAILELTGQVSGAVTEAFLDAGRETAATEERIRRDVFNELLSGPVAGVGPIRSRAERVGYRLGEFHAVAVVTLPGIELLSQSGALAADIVLRDVVSAIKASSASIGTPIVEARGLMVFAVVALDAQEPARRLVSALDRALDGVRLPPPVSALGAVGRVERGVAGIPVSYRQAMRALDGARIAGCDTRMASFEDMLPVLLLLQDPSLATDLWRSTIEPLARQDASGGTQLVATLQALLEERGNLIATAKRLFVHRHTLSARLDRIEELTGRSLRDGTDILLLGLGLRAPDVIPAASAPAAAADVSPIDMLSKLRAVTSDIQSVSGRKA